MNAQTMKTHENKDLRNATICSGARFKKQKPLVPAGDKTLTLEENSGVYRDQFRGIL